MAARTAEDKSTEPTKEQIEAAKKAYAKHGATLRIITDSKTKKISYVFDMRGRTRDADLKGLTNLPFHFGLYLRGTQVSDAGLKHLKGLKKLTDLGLRFTQVSDAGLAYLKDLKKLTALSLFRTKVTKDGVKELRKALPKCKIAR